MRMQAAQRFTGIVLRQIIKEREKVMKKSFTERFTKSVIRDITEDMRETVKDGDNRLSWEKRYGKGTLHVEVEEVRLNNGCQLTTVDVYAEHERDEEYTECPNIKKAIEDALPQFCTLREEMQESGDVDEGFRDLHDYYQYRYGHFAY